MAKKKLIESIFQLGQAIVDYHAEGGRYSLETETGTGNTVIVLHDVALRYDEVATVVNGAPAYRLEYCGGPEVE